MNDTVLLKIYRQFTQDEAINLLKAKIKELKVEIGTYKSIEAELKYKNDLMRKEKGEAVHQRNIVETRLERIEKKLQECTVELDIRTTESMKDERFEKMKLRKEEYKKKYFDMVNQFCDLKIKYDKLYELDKCNP